jgi:hypothetical protein
METPLNIVELIENNPITRLSATYQSKLLTKIQEGFTELEQQTFVSSFYCYLNYNQTNDYVIDLDNVWKWLGFSSKFNAKRLLEKKFTLDLDYKQSLIPNEKQTSACKGGHNNETFLLTVKTFKSYCVKVGTKRAEQIHEYYIKLEETLQDVFQEESNELKTQLQYTENKLEHIEHKLECAEIDKYKIREKTIIEQFPQNTQSFYYGIIKNVSDKNEKLIKFGISNNLKSRTTQHHKTYLNFNLINAFKVKNKLEMETAFKDHFILKPRIRTITIKSKKYVELLAVDGISFTELDNYIKEIIGRVEYSYENYIKLQHEVRLLKQQIEELNHQNHIDECIILRTENIRLQTENKMLIKKCNAIAKQPHIPLQNNDTDPIVNYISVIDTLKRPIKNKEGKYNINGRTYDNLFGTRADVWRETAYKTTGGLTKNDLMLNQNGNIVSKKKSIHETLHKRLFKCGVNTSIDDEEVPLSGFSKCGSLIIIPPISEQP